MTVTLKTVALNDTHQQLGAKMVPFAGYNMPVRYSSDLDEHHTVPVQAVEGVHLFPQVGVQPGAPLPNPLPQRAHLRVADGRLGRVGAVEKRAQLGLEEQVLDQRAFEILLDVLGGHLVDGWMGEWLDG